jgi:hypothetical protein
MNKQFGIKLLVVRREIVRLLTGLEDAPLEDEDRTSALATIRRLNDISRELQELAEEILESS